MTATGRADVIVVGGGQAGMTAGYYLSKTGTSFLILDAAAQAGQAWRQRWDSLELFTPARYSSLPGLGFPGDPGHYPGKDEVAGYLADYARAFALPVRYGSRVTALEEATFSWLRRSRQRPGLRGGLVVTGVQRAGKHGPALRVRRCAGGLWRLGRPAGPDQAIMSAGIQGRPACR